jgi:DNA mismatch endonuclease (patch repair protein)
MDMGRSENMRRIRSKNTAPEIIARRLLRGLGFSGYRIHRRELPGKPDIVFMARRKAIMVHGCFWHGHCCNEGQRQPKSNQDYWIPKINRNRSRDAAHLTDLGRLGWSVITVWECEIKEHEILKQKLLNFLT